ncbi:MAG: SDR family NAD(P)-dependent oxidoreductase [Pseudomonadota bacterium]
MKMTGKRVLVTGGSSGIGLEVSRALADAGADVVVTGRDASQLKRVALQNPGLTAHVCDVTNDFAVRGLVKAMEAEGGLDVLVNNAGVSQFLDVVQAPPLAIQQDDIDINVVGPIRLIHRFLPLLLQRPSIIVNVSSGTVFVPFAAAPVYSASKAFVHAYSRCLRTQLGETSVRVVELLPPIVDTPMSERINVEGLEKLPARELARALLRGLENGVDEIAPGLSRRLRVMNRIAPGFIYQQLNGRPLVTDA